MTMNEQMIRAIITCNNRCIEQCQSGSFLHALSELRGAFSLMNQSVTIVDPTASTSHVTCVNGVLQQPSSSMPLQTFQSIPENHLLPQQSSSIMVSVQIKFYLDESSTSGTANAVTSTPIVPSFHLLCIVPVDQDDTRPSMTEQQHRIGSTDAISKEDSHLISATLLYNMGLLFHQHANACHPCRGTHNASSNSTFIVQALKIYELLIQLCNHIDIWKVSSTQDPMQDYCFYLRVIHMFAYNNYAEICYNVGKYDTYQHCMKNLQCQLQFFSNMIRNDGNNLPSSGEFEIIYNNLRLNALLAKLFPSPMLASAA